jgi:DNA-binding MarR family transcriptional regulator
VAAVPDDRGDGGADPSAAEPLTKEDFEALARFRFGIRRYLRFSEETVRRHGVTPQQYQLMLALKGFPGRDWAVVRELAERLQLRHHSVVELVDRAQAEGLVQRGPHPGDARSVRVELTGAGEQLLGRLSALHRDELRRMDAVLVLPHWHTPDRRPEARTSGAQPGALPDRTLPTGTPPAGETGRPADHGGDPACWLTRVCSACGRLDDGPPPTRCPGCGAPLTAD